MFITLIAIDSQEDNDEKTETNIKLETVSIAEPLQNRQHARETPNAVNTRRERE